MAKDKPQIQLPRDRLRRIDLGQAFAEYDKILQDPHVFVRTPAVEAALSPLRSKFIFVGRRGTGKTALALHLSQKDPKRTLSLTPLGFHSNTIPTGVSSVDDTQRPEMRSLIACWKHTIFDEVLLSWTNRQLIKLDHLPEPLKRERNNIESLDFDGRFFSFVESTFSAQKAHDQKTWAKQVSRSKQIETAFKSLRTDAAWDTTIAFDRIDEAWDGTDEAVVVLIGLLHACIEIASNITFIRPLVFLRENVFERVRQIDKEFSRLETCVTSMDWTEEYLLELVERRLQKPFTQRLAIGGPTWDAFFDNVDSHSSFRYVFDFCQQRPRDILTYLTFAVEAANARKSERVAFEDLQIARKRFSDSRFKDLCDEYSENYPHLQLVLGRFYGLAQEYTVSAIAAFIQKLLVDAEVQANCGTWLKHASSPETFIDILFNIGFIGIRTSGSLSYRTLGARTTMPPATRADSDIVIHPTFHEALWLQTRRLTQLAEGIVLQQQGVLVDLPESFDLTSYNDKLTELTELLKKTPAGRDFASKYEELVGEVIRLCFWRSLGNLQAQVRTEDGCQRRDWIAANIAANGFWEMIRQRYDACQIVWECKNMESLDAAAFHQADYYMSKAVGRCVVLCFRGEIENHYYSHIKNIINGKDGIIILVTDNDLKVFLRQAMKGKNKEGHIREIFDRIVRAC